MPYTTRRVKILFYLIACGSPSSTLGFSVLQGTQPVITLFGDAVDALTKNELFRGHHHCDD